MGEIGVNREMEANMGVNGRRWDGHTPRADIQFLTHGVFEKFLCPRIFIRVLPQLGYIKTICICLDAKFIYTA